MSGTAILRILKSLLIVKDISIETKISWLTPSKTKAKDVRKRCLCHIYQSFSVIILVVFKHTDTHTQERRKIK